MIAPPAGWTVSTCDGGLLLVPPGGAQLGALRYLERVRPLRAVNDLVRALPSPVGWSEQARTPIERLVTREGEYGAFLAATGAIDTLPCERTFGFVFGDDHFARLTGICFQPEAFASFRALVRRLVVADAQLLGLRRRRYVYRPPAGWQALASLFHATWIPPGYPREDASILVMPAVPKLPGLKEGLVVDTAQLANPEEVFLDPPRALPERAGLAAEVFRLRRSSTREATLVVLEDERFTYAVRLDASAGADASALYTLVDSIQPIPRPGDADAAELSVTMTHWTE